MLETITILNSGEKSKESVPQDSYLNMSFKQDYGIAEDTDIVGSLDQYEQYLKEMGQCTRYRFICTINPIISNVLFNPKTIIHNSDFGSNKYGKRIIDKPPGNTELTSFIYNPYLDPGNYDITKEYTEDDKYKDLPLTYLPGYDIFDNITFRTNEKFALARCMDDLRTYISPKTGKPYEKKDGIQYLFNYIMDDIITYEKGIRDNISENNGWVGFKKPMKLRLTDENRSNHGINDSVPAFDEHKKNCDFTEMFPNSNSLTFVPQSNKTYTSEKPDPKEIIYVDEENWKFYLTYPYESVYEHFLVTDVSDGMRYADDKQAVNGIPIMYVKEMEPNDDGNPFSYPVFELTTAYSHGLVAEDRFKVRKRGSEGKSLNVLQVIDSKKFLVGKTSSSFSTGDCEKARVIKINKDGYDCEYYIRKFRKIPNWRFEQTELTLDNIEEKLKNEETTHKELSHKIYNLSYSRNIFNDKISQLTYKETIETKYLKDNLGRPLTEIFLTVVKCNESEIEYSPESTAYKTRFNRYFSNNMSGFDLTPILTKPNMQFQSADKYKKNYPNVNTLHNLERMPNKKLDTDDSLPFTVTPKNSDVTKDTPDNPIERKFPMSPDSLDGFDDKISNVDKEENIFLYGDICEFSASEFLERTLTTVRYRFNTVNRESFEDTDRVIIFHHIYYDDMDRGTNISKNAKLPVSKVERMYTPKDGKNSKVGEYPTTAEVPTQEIQQYNYNQCEGFTDSDPFIYRGYLNAGPRPEGYTYKAHYKTQLLNYSSNISQKTFSPVRFTQMKAETLNGVNVLSFITFNPHKLITDSLIRIYVPDEFPVFDHAFKVILTSRDPYKFSISPNDQEIAIINKGGNNIKVTNWDYDTPLYARRSKDGSYMWRELLLNGETDSVDGDENRTLPFANGALYVHENFNFYLRRQGGSMYYNDFPSDLGYNEYDIEDEIYNKENDIC